MAANVSNKIIFFFKFYLLKIKMELKVKEWNGRSTTMLSHRKNITLSNSYYLSNYFDKKNKICCKKNILLHKIWH